MQLNMELPEDALNQLKKVMLDSAKKAYEEAGRQKQFRDYLTKGEACDYLHVSDKTLNKFILKGLQVSAIDNVQRISKAECDRFMLEHQI